MKKTRLALSNEEISQISLMDEYINISLEREDLSRNILQLQKQINHRRLIIDNLKKILGLRYAKVLFAFSSSDIKVSISRQEGVVTFKMNTDRNRLFTGKDDVLTKIRKVIVQIESDIDLIQTEISYWDAPEDASAFRRKKILVFETKTEVFLEENNLQRLLGEHTKVFKIALGSKDEVGEISFDNTDEKFEEPRIDPSKKTAWDVAPIERDTAPDEEDIALIERDIAVDAPGSFTENSSIADDDRPPEDFDITDSDKDFSTSKP